MTGKNIEISSRYVADFSACLWLGEDKEKAIKIRTLSRKDLPN